MKAGLVKKGCVSSISILSPIVDLMSFIVFHCLAAGYILGRWALLECSPARTLQ